MSKVTSSREKTRSLVFIALFSVFMAVCSQISIPAVVPITMQTFAVYLALYFLGGKKGTVAICLYVLLGLVGLPVYANFNTGVGALMGITGGYIVGWILSGLVAWIFEKIFGARGWVRIVYSLIGLAVSYATGTAWFIIAYTGTGGSVSVWTALLWCVVPFVLPDVLKICAAIWLADRMKRIR